MKYVLVYHYAILLCFFLSFFSFHKNNRKVEYLKLFPFFLLTTLLVELYAGYLSYRGKSNTLLYNIFSTIEFVFYILILREIIINKKAKKVVLYLSVFYPLTALINIFFIQKPIAFHSITYSLGCLIVVGLSIYYFYELFKLPRIGKLNNNPAFWICTALLFFYCCTFPLISLSNFWSNSAVWKTLEKTYNSINYLLNIFLYTLFSISFLCSIKIRKSIS